MDKFSKRKKVMDEFLKKKQVLNYDTTIPVPCVFVEALYKRSMFRSSQNININMRANEFLPNHVNH